MNTSVQFESVHEPLFKSKKYAPLPMNKFRLVLCGMSCVAVAFSAGCTSVAVDPAKIADIKTVTITRLELPEYSYHGRDREAAAKGVATIGSYYVLGVFGLAAADAMRAKSEQPYRDAIKAALIDRPPSFEAVLNSRLEEVLTERGIKVNWMTPPARLADNSGYDFSSVDATTDYVIEIFPFAAGFSYEGAASNPNVDIRWRLIKRYPGGKLIETNRGTVFYDAGPSIGSMSSVQIPTRSDFSLAGHVTDLKNHGDKPVVAMRTIAEHVAKITVERALPSTQTK